MEMYDSNVHPMKEIGDSLVVSRKPFFSIPFSTGSLRMSLLDVVHVKRYRPCDRRRKERSDDHHDSLHKE